MPKLTVDGVEIEVPQGATVLQTAEMCGAIDRVFEFEQARAAFEHLEAARHVGKIVIRL